MANLPSPLGESMTGGSNPAGDTFSIVDIATEPIKVTVVNWPPTLGVSPAGTSLGSSKLPPPLPTTPIPPPLPGQSFALNSPPLLPQDRADVLKVKVMNQSPMPVMLTGGSITGIGKQVNKPGPLNVPKGGGGGGTSLIAGLGAAAAGFFTAAKLMEPFNATIGSLIESVKGGVAGGFTKGAGGEVLGKAATALGVALGVNLLPQIIETSAAMIDLADDFTKTNRNIRQFRKEGQMMGDTFNNAGEKINRGEGDTRSWLDMLDDWSDRVAERNDFFGGLVRGSRKKSGPAGEAAKGPDGRPLPETAEEKAAREKRAKREKMEGMIYQSIQSSLGPQASYQGVADVRQQAQLAAMEDPINRMIRDMAVEALNDWKKRREDVTRSANNTAPPAA